MDAVAVSMLNGNLIISCWLPGDEENSRLSLVGTERIDDTVCIIFDHLCEKGDPSKLVHVPEFVIGSVHYPELFKLTSERDYDECVVPVPGLYPLSNATSRLQWRIGQFF